MKQRIKLKSRKILTGTWDYISETISDIDVKKGDKSFIGLQDLYEDLEHIKIGNKFYDIEKVENSTIYLAEEIEEDFIGKTHYTLQLPIKIKSDTELLEIELDSDEFMTKPNRKKIPLNKASKQDKMTYMKELQESAKNSDIEASQVSLIIIDTIEDKKILTKNMFIKQIIGLVAHIDMDYEIEEGVTLWQHMGIAKDNYVELAKYLTSKEMGILSDSTGIESLRLTIEAIKAKKDVDMYILETQARDLQIKTQVMLKQMKNSFASEEEFNRFVGLDQ